MTLQHGGAISVLYSGLQPGTSYSVSSVDGVFNFAWTDHSKEFTPAGTQFGSSVTMPSSDASDQVELELAETGQSAVLASLTIPVAPAALNLTAQPCSGGQFTVGFVQAKPYSYRLLVPPATNKPVALSNTVSK